MVQLFLHKNMNIVVAKSEEENGKVSVAYVGKDPTLPPAKRRGKRPAYSEPVSVSELVAMENPSEDLVKRAEVALAPPAETTEPTPGE